MNDHPSDRQDPRDLDALYARGLATRREVLGADYVDQAIAGADDFSPTWPCSRCRTARTSSSCT